MSNKGIIIKNPDIISFYQQNPNINIESINLFFIDIIKKLSTNLSSIMHDNNINKIMTMVTDMSNMLNKMDMTFNLKILELKKEYVDELKNVIDNKKIKDKDEIQNIMERNHTNLVAKTQLLLNEFVPRTQEGYFKIEKDIKEHFNIINTNSKRILEQVNKDDNLEIVNKIDDQFGKIISLIQQPIYSFIQSSEERTNSNIQQIKENIYHSKQSQENLGKEINNFLNKYKNNSNVKGNISETELYYVLQKIMPSDEIIRCGSETATCDFKVNRCDPNKPTILFENKNYSGTVDTEEIKKFERDVQTQRKHGIFLSQNSPITFKTDFHIDIINGLILVYVPNAEYDMNKIKVAIDIVDKLSIHVMELVEKSKSSYKEEHQILKNSDLTKIIKEYNEFGLKKLETIDMLKFMTKQMMEKIDEIQMPNLNKYLMGTGQYKSDKLLCSICEKFNGKNKSSLAAHMRNCSVNTNIKSSKNKNNILKENIEIKL